MRSLQSSGKLLNSKAFKHDNEAKLCWTMNCCMALSPFLLRQRTRWSGVGRGGLRFHRRIIGFGC